MFGNLVGSLTDVVSDVGGSMFGADLFGGGRDMFGGGDLLSRVGGGGLFDGVLDQIVPDGLLGSGLGTIAGGIFGGPVGAMAGGFLESIIAGNGDDAKAVTPLDGIMRLLQSTPLGQGLAFQGYEGKGQVGNLSLAGQPTTVDNESGVLAAATGLTDVLAAAITGGDPELTPQLSAIFLNAISGAQTNDEALESVRSLMDALGLTRAEVAQALTAQLQSGNLTLEQYDEHMEYLSMLENDPLNAGGGATARAYDSAGVGAPRLTEADSVDGAEGFLFKPVSESDGNLVVLLPSEMTGDVEGMTLRDANGEVIEVGDNAGVANGGREHFRFDRAGGDYPPNLTVEVTLKDGSVTAFQIGDPSERYD